ncbi:MAG: hypothetical protein AB7C97_04795 [Oscillospiraceae bacterium]
MGIVKKFIRRLMDMSMPAYLIIKWGLIISCLMLTAALAIMLAAGETSAHTYNLYRIAKELYSFPAAILLVVAIASVCIEERFMK